MRSPAIVQRLRLTALGLALVAVTAIWASAAFAAPEKVAGGIKFLYHDANAKTVYWAGLFNNWSTSANPLVKGGDGTWSVVLPLTAGEQQYKFVVDGQWIADPENPVTGGDYGNSVVKVGNDGSLVTQQATSNTAYSPRIFMGGRTIGLYQEDYDPLNGRYELTRPTFDMDLDWAIRVSDVMQAHALLNINAAQEDVQAYRSRLNLKRGSLVVTQPKFQMMAYDSDTLATWDDPLTLVGDMGVYHHPYGAQRQGVQLKGEYAHFRGELLYDDNFDDRLITNSPLYAGFTIDNFPSYIIQGPTNIPRYVFESDPIGKSFVLMRTQRTGAGTGTGYGLVPGQASKVLTQDMGDNGRLYGYGNTNMNTAAMRVSRSFVGGLDASFVARMSRGFNLGRMIYSEVTGDSTANVFNTLYSQEWYGAGGVARWTPRTNMAAFAELQAGARRMAFVNGSVSTPYKATRIVPDSTYATASGPSQAIDGTHMTTDKSVRGIFGGNWTFAQGDITLRGDVRFETHAQPYWTQAPVVPGGTVPTSYESRFLTADFQRGAYLGATDELHNHEVTWHVAWDRNWRYYLNREVLTSLDLEWTNFTYDDRTAWQDQLWFPTGNFWLESGQHVASLDRLTMLGQAQVVRLKPVVQVPFWSRRAGQFTFRGTYDGVRLDRQPRYAESRFGLGFQVRKTVRFRSDTRWIKYDAPDMALDRGFVSSYNGFVLAPAKGIELSLGVGVDPSALDPVTNEYADHGREVFLDDLNANGFIAETDYTSLARQIAAAEKAMQTLRRIQLQAVVHF